MTRRRRKSEAEVFVSIVAKLPWWIGVGLAVGSYFLLHRLAATPPPVVTGAREVGQILTGQLVRVLAGFGQYVIPLLFLVGAVGSAAARWKRRQLHATTAKHSDVGALNRMGWQEFEMLVGEAFRRRGYEVAERGGGGADGGVDLVLRKDGERFLVQCKRWRARRVGVKIVRELYGVIAAEDAAGGFVVTSGAFTKEASAFAAGKEIELLDGPRLLELIQGVDEGNKPRLHGGSQQAPQTSRQHGHGEIDPPDCPRCGNTMVVRVAKRGTQAGKRFWGCPGFPNCRGTVAIDEPG